MDHSDKLDDGKLTGKPAKMRDWLKKNHLPPGILFLILGISSTIWFLIRVIPKPSRAAYPCMRVAAPVMSGFVIYLLSLSGISLAFRKARQNFSGKRYLPFVIYCAVMLTGFIVAISRVPYEVYSRNAMPAPGPDDGPNQPMGRSSGEHPGRVVWAWNPDATNENCTNNITSGDFYFRPENTNKNIVAGMISSSLIKLSGKSTVKEAWDSFFRHLNLKKYKKDAGYIKGEKIFIKINQGTSRWLLTQEEKNGGYNMPTSVDQNDTRKKQSIPPTETNPYVVLEILKELVVDAGVDQSDIFVGDPMTDIYAHNYEVWHSAYPEVKYIDKVSEMHGRTLIHPTEKDLLFYSDKSQSDKLFDVIEKADYLINIANLKPHGIAGVTFTAKNHFGSQARETASHLHYSLINPRGGVATNGGYRKYRVLVDLMGSKYLGQNTLLYLVDGLFGGGASETKPPVRYFMEPFNNDWSSSIFMSLDQVALESVCYDFLRTEWNGVNKHDPANNSPEISPSYKGVDDYLHQAADPANWPEGIKYDPDGTNTPLSSLGIHEHWNNPQMKQYSVNLGRKTGIELLTIPDNLVKSTAQVNDAFTKIAGFSPGISARIFSSAAVDNNNVKWFISDQGIVSFDGNRWVLHDNNRKVPKKELRSITFEVSSYGPEVWIATSQGATVASLPIDARSGATTYYTENSKILSNDVRLIAIGKDPLRWIATDRGISAFNNKTWLTVSYQRIYPEELFKNCPVTSLATNPGGDTLYIGTAGAGVARVFKNAGTDAISGASEYAQWGTILMPSDTVYSLFIDPKGTQWIGTSAGVACHKGHNTLENWTVYNTDNGLVNNCVKAISMDKRGNMWFGTGEGISVFNGSVWTTYNAGNGLPGNNILCITTDKTGTVWIGTDNGLTSFNDNSFTVYK